MADFLAEVDRSGPRVPSYGIGYENDEDEL